MNSARYTDTWRSWRITWGLPMWFSLKLGFRAKIGISRKNRDFRRPWAKYWDFKCTRWAAPSVCTLKSLFFAMGALWALEIHVFCKEVHMRAPMAKFWDFKVHTEGTHEGRLSDWFECMLLWYDSSNTLLNHWRTIEAIAHEHVGWWNGRKNIGERERLWKEMTTKRDSDFT